MHFTLAKIGGAALAILAQAAESSPEEVPPLFKVKAYLILILLMLVLLGLIVFNRLMARWARRSTDAARKRRQQGAQRSTYDPDADDWAQQPMVDDNLGESRE